MGSRRLPPSSRAMGRAALGLLQPLAPLVLLLPAAVSGFIGGFWVVVDRVSLRLAPFQEAPFQAIAAVSVAGLAGLAGAYLGGGESLRRAVGRILAGIVVLEVLALASLLLLEYRPLVVAGLYRLLLNIVLAERSLWLGLTYLVPLALPLAVAYAYLRAPVEARSVKRTGSTGSHYLVLAFVVAVLSVVIPHSSPVNPSRTVVSTDAVFNAAWIRSYLEKGLVGAFEDTINSLRPAYMAFLFAFYELVGGDPEAFADIVLPGLGFLLLALSTYWFAQIQPGSMPGLASLLALLYWSPAFVYGGFQTNLYALSIALVASRLLFESRTRLFLLIATILGLWHPWTLVYYTVAWLAYQAAYSESRIASMETLARLAVAILPLAATVATDMLLLAIFAKDSSALLAIAKPAVPKPLTGPYEALFLQVWGTMARPEVSLAIIPLVLRGQAGLGTASLLLPAAFFPLLGSTSSFRLLLEAPLPLLAHQAYRGREFMLIVPAVSWYYFMVNSVMA